MKTIECTVNDVMKKHHKLFTTPGKFVLWTCGGADHNPDSRKYFPGGGHDETSKSIQFQKHIVKLFRALWENGVTGVDIYIPHVNGYKTPKLFLSPGQDPNYSHYGIQPCKPRYDSNGDERNALWSLAHWPPLYMNREYYYKHEIEVVQHENIISIYCTSWDIRTEYPEDSIYYMAPKRRRLVALPIETPSEKVAHAFLMYKWFRASWLVLHAPMKIEVEE